MGNCLYLGFFTQSLEYAEHSISEGLGKNSQRWKFVILLHNNDLKTGRDLAALFKLS
jgi:hypothetical protein